MPDFINERFPTTIKYGSVGGPTFAARELRSPSGNEQIITLWDASKIEWTFDHMAWDEAMTNTLLDFWEVVGGIGPGFRFRDWSNWNVGMKRLSPNAPLTHAAELAHEFAEGDGVETDFQLYRVRKLGAYERRVKITRPMKASEADIKIYAWDDPDWVEITSGVDTDRDTGIVTFDDPPADGLRLAWSGPYDYPVRFAVSNPNLTLSAMAKGNMAGLRVLGLKE